MRPHWIRDDLNLMTEVLIRKGKFGQRHVEENSRWRWWQKLEWWVYRPRDIKNCQQPPETVRETWNRFSLKASSRNQSCWHQDFRLLAPGVWENTFLLFRATQHVVVCSGGPRKQIPITKNNQPQKAHLCLLVGISFLPSYKVSLCIPTDS